MLDRPPNVARMFSQFRWKQREPESFKMNLIDAPVETQEQNNEYAAHQAANALCEAQYCWQYKLTLFAGNCFKEHIRRWQPCNQRLLEGAALQPRWQSPGPLHR